MYREVNETILFLKLKQKQNFISFNQKRISFNLNQLIK